MVPNPEAHTIMQGSPLHKVPCVVKTVGRTAGGGSHWHDHAQLWYVTCGTLIHSVGEKTYVQNPGSLVFVAPYIPHLVNSEGSSDEPEVICISFTDKFLTNRGFNFFSYDGRFANIDGFHIPEYVAPEGVMREKVSRLVNEICNESSKQRALSRFDNIAAHTAELLLTVKGEKLKPKGYASAKEHALAVTKSVRYMSHNYPQKMTIKSLCSMVAMSQTTFVREFKKTTNTTFSKLLINIRVRAARRLLLETDKKVSTIASETGFYDESHFVHAFSGLNGATPAEYRIKNMPIVEKTIGELEKGEIPPDEFGFLRINSSIMEP
ncbi:MAG: helix-turn-helix domain-containing protein [Oscillospiraceae bacterium]|nr:helix-turn-helix domain-containing protein [Oscillospiraceae bacterium]